MARKLNRLGMSDRYPIAPEDLDAYLDSTARRIGLTISADQRPGVLANLRLAGEMAARVMSVPVAELDLAGVYTPAERR